jgi:hypothetical protein
MEINLCLMEFKMSATNVRFFDRLSMDHPKKKVDNQQPSHITLHPHSTNLLFLYILIM